MTRRSAITFRSAASSVCSKDGITPFSGSCRTIPATAPRPIRRRRGRFPIDWLFSTGHDNPLYAITYMSVSAVGLVSAHSGQDHRSADLHRQSRGDDLRFRRGRLVRLSRPLSVVRPFPDAALFLRCTSLCDDRRRSEARETGPYWGRAREGEGSPLPGLRPLSRPPARVKWAFRA
jgi:hypothetical protein